MAVLTAALSSAISIRIGTKNFLPQGIQTMARRWEVGCLAICVIPNTVNQGSRLPLNTQEAVSHGHFTVGTVCPCGYLPRCWGNGSQYRISCIPSYLAVNTLKRVRTLSPSR